MQHPFACRMQIYNLRRLSSGVWALTRDLDYHGHGYYEKKRNGRVVVTSLGNRPDCAYVAHEGRISRMKGGRRERPREEDGKHEREERSWYELRARLLIEEERRGRNVNLVTRPFFDYMRDVSFISSMQLLSYCILMKDISTCVYRLFSAQRARVSWRKAQNQKSNSVSRKRRKTFLGIGRFSPLRARARARARSPFSHANSERLQRITRERDGESRRMNRLRGSTLEHPNIQKVLISIRKTTKSFSRFTVFFIAIYIFRDDI